MREIGMYRLSREHDIFLFYILPSLSRGFSPLRVMHSWLRERTSLRDMRARPLVEGLVLAIVFASGGEVSADPLRCASTITAESSRYVQAVVKALGRCEDSKVTGALPAGTDCATDAATAALLTKADARLRMHIDANCGGADRTCGTADDIPLTSTGWNIGTCPGFPPAACQGAIAD